MTAIGRVAISASLRSAATRLPVGKPVADSDAYARRSASTESVMWTASATPTRRKARTASAATSKVASVYSRRSMAS